MPKLTKAEKEKMMRENCANPKFQALLQRAGSLSAVQSAKIDHFGISFHIRPCDLQAASLILDTLSRLYEKNDR